MAGFTTHLSGAAISAGIIASSFSLTGLFSVSEVAWVWAVGVGAGLLPDIDSDTSVALKALFNVLGVVASLAVLVFYPEQPLLYLWAMMLSAFVLCRFVIMEAFVRFTVHRGALHSILAGGMFGLLTVALVSGVLEDNVDYAWAMGVAVFFGYLTHLILDELSSVNLSGAEIKRSFGSAFKLFSLRHL
ncbi:MAG: metal-dependent hydrolase, partial [Bdellovibrionales bacterium]|nr:metal-dependent hydrolase [Bdellovibrionales bacterium]